MRFTQWIFPKSILLPLNAIFLRVTFAGKYERIEGEWRTFRASLCLNAFAIPRMFFSIPRFRLSNNRRISIRAIGHGNRTRRFEEGVRQKRERTRGVQPRNLMLAPLPLPKVFRFCGVENPKAETIVSSQVLVFPFASKITSRYSLQRIVQLFDQFFLSNRVLKLSGKI